MASFNFPLRSRNVTNPLFDPFSSSTVAGRRSNGSASASAFAAFADLALGSPFAFGLPVAASPDVVG